MQWYVIDIGYNCMTCRHRLWSSDQRNQQQQPQPDPQGDVTGGNVYNNSDVVAGGPKPDIIYAHIDAGVQDGDRATPPKVRTEKDAVIYSDLLSAVALSDDLCENISW